VSEPLTGEDRDARARAQALLDRLPPEPPEKRERRLLLQRRQWVRAVVLLAAAVALVGVVVVADARLTMGPSPAHLPGYLFGWSGRVLADPSPVWFATVALLLAATGAALRHQRRDARRLQRFLDEHPAPAP
jgi:hypothetical protein